MFDEFKNENEEQPFRHQNPSEKKRSYANRARSLAPFLLGLSLLACNPQVANAVQQQTTPFAKIQTDEQTTDYQLQLEKGTRRMNAFIEMLESEFYEDGSLKSETVLQSHQDIAKTMKKQDPNTFDKYAGGIDIYPLSTKNYSLLIANGEVVRCYSLDGDITERLKNGEAKVLEQIEKYLSDTDDRGRLKNEEERESGVFFAQALAGYLNSPSFLKNLAQQNSTSGSAIEQALAKRNKLLEDEYVYADLDRNIYFLSEIIQDENDYGIVYHDGERSMVVNYRYYAVFQQNLKNGWMNLTAEKQKAYQNYYEERFVP